ncbi:TPA: phage DNA ejection protein [Escherichia coli]
MATWQLGGLPSMAPQNDNAPRSSVPQPVQYQQQPNVGLMALQGLRGVAEINQQARQQQRKAEFQKAYAGAFESGDRNKMRSLISEYPEEFESVQKGMGFIDDDQRNSIGHLATSAQIASSLGTGAFGKFIADNEDEMRRLGISPESVAEMHVNDPQGFQRLAGSMALFSLGHEKYFDIKDQMEGRDIERGKLAETIRSNQAGEALQARGQDISRANALTSAYAPTAAMQNYNQYAQMLKADPEGAAAFAAAAGINTNAKKLMSVRENDDGTVTKYYTDGSEEQGKLNQPISGDGFRPIALPTAQKIMEKSPEGAKKAAGFAYRVRDALDSMDTLKGQISPQRVAIINNALGKATDPSGNISVEKFINALHRNRKQSATFFKGVHGKELDGIIKYLNDTRQAAKVDGQKLNSQKLYGLLVGGGAINAAVLAGMLKTAAFVVPAAGALGGAAKAYESPVIRNALLRLANTPKGSTAYDRAISTVTQSLTTAAQASQKEAQ